MNKRKSEVEDNSLVENKKIKLNNPSTNSSRTGTIRKLAPPQPDAITVTGRASAVASTSKVKSMNVINLSRKKSPQGYIKRIRKAILDDGHLKVTLNALSAAIPFALQVISLLRVELSQELDIKLYTRTVDVVDERIPSDKEEDISRETRSQSALKVVIRLPNCPSDEELTEETKQIPPPIKTKNRGVKRRQKDQRKAEARANNVQVDK